MNKKAMQLSMNFLVIVILSIAMLSMGVVLFRKIFTGATELKANLDKQTEQELENMLTAGERVAIPFTKKEVRAGKTIVFGLGILNIIGEESNFIVDIRCTNVVPSGSCIPLDDIIHSLKTGPVSIKNNEQLKIPIAIATEKTTSKGTHILDIKVCDYLSTDPVPSCDGINPNEFYDGSLHKIYVKVT